MKACAHCGQPIIFGRKTKTYCSLQCKRTAARKRLWSKEMGNPIPMKSTCKLANEAGNENEHVQFWKRAKEADQNFCLAMRHAIATGKENPLIGVDKRPGTQNPITIGPAFVPVGGSSIGLCADIGSDKGRGHKW